ncbi:methyl-accepting chemotaxis protein [Roseobacter sinensis]|uniref:Methyl-accepting chemotaxis protein n=1 Tax=Roseobacter sinensis TaxID=2931391 RepID=A0ABT3BBU2_9RHOB|nr:methyl-accepting chemotaxis protein [Roseobacter sp. WL0113]MCV3271037.1 methyl-accepting chemotaxis protein [Roseobacter sp. WL0113]
MTIQTEITTPDAATIDTLPFRTAIDRVATLRTLVMRMALKVSQLAADPTEEQRAALKEDAEAQAGTLRHTHDVLCGKAIFDDLPEALSAWLATVAQDQRGGLTAIARMADMTDGLRDTAEEGDAAEPDGLDTYVAYAQGDFFDAVTALTEHIWVQVDDGRATQLERAMQSATRLGEGLSRLERIGKYVRSMSINASVEASRAGEAGKGLAIIAQEFKVLAEEVQELTYSARQDIESIENS